MKVNKKKLKKSQDFNRESLKIWNSNIMKWFRLQKNCKIKWMIQSRGLFKIEPKYKIWKKLKKLEAKWMENISIN